MEKEQIYWTFFGKKLIGFKKLENGEIVGTGLLNPILEKLRLIPMLYLQTKFFRSYNLGR